MIYVTCEFETPIGRSDYNDYVRSLRLDVSGCDDVNTRKSKTPESSKEQKENAIDHSHSCDIVAGRWVQGRSV